MTLNPWHCLPIAVAMATAAESASPQAAPVAQPAPVVTPAMRSAIASLKSDLRNLGTAEEAFFADSVKYTVRLTAYTASRGNTVRVLTATTAAWTAVGTSEQLPGMSCVMYVGNVPAPQLPQTLAQKRSGAEGEPTCDELPKATPVDVVLDRELTAGYLPSFTTAGVSVRQGGFEAAGCVVHWENTLAPLAKEAFDSIKVSTFVEFGRLASTANAVDTLGMSAVILKSRATDSAFTSTMTIYAKSTIRNQLVREVEGGFFLRDKAARDRALAAVGRVMEYCTPK